VYTNVVTVNWCSFYGADVGSRISCLINGSRAAIDVRGTSEAVATYVNKDFYSGLVLKIKGF
jgi:hypothetical protein